MADDPTPTPEPVTDPSPTPPPPVGEHEPEWARKLRETIEALPGKLNATITDDDHRKLGESVYDFFERGGAFVKPEESKQDEPKTEPETKTDEPPKQGGKLSSFAHKYFGEG